MLHTEIIKLLALQAQLKSVKAEEMKLRKSIMTEISEGYEGERKKFEYIYENMEVEVVCDMALKLDESLFRAYINDGKMESCSPEELACIKSSYSLNKTALKSIDVDSIIYELIDSKPALSSIKIKHNG